jgi:hypothetical protein
MKFKLTNNKTYNEVGQKNPLRWKTLFKDGDTFVDQSGWIKCKDFFNDTLAFFKVGSVFSIYGYKNDIKKNDEGVYFLLKCVDDKPTFFHNTNVMNERLKKDLGVEVPVWDVDEQQDQVLLLIPNKLWDSTYYLSLVTMIIRCCNYGYKYEYWEDIFHSQAPMNTVEHAFSREAKEHTMANGFVLPKGYEKYWFYAGKQHNSEVAPKTTGGIIHDNGVVSWLNAIRNGY